MELNLERDGDRYTLLDGEAVRWSSVQRLDMAGTPFREELLWPDAGVALIAGGPEVRALALGDGRLVWNLRLDGDLFGHFAADGDAVYVLGWRHVTALRTDLSVRWTARDLAVDGIVFGGRTGDLLRLSCELDPPGGWVEVVLDARSGRRVDGGRS